MHSYFSSNYFPLVILAIYAPQRQLHIDADHAFDSEVSAGMRAFNVKTNTEEVNRQKGDGGVRNHGINNVMACEAERSKEEKERLHTSDTFSASDHAPELVVFIQESDYLSVKDIFIDSVVPSQGVLSYKDIYSNEIQQDFQGYVRKQHALDKLMKDGEADHLDGRDGHLLFKSTEKIIPGMQRVKEVRRESKPRNTKVSMPSSYHWLVAHWQ